ncbi:MAG: hypothetical protein LBU32_07580 [Clostridiales bacterium]|jgi:hypothetical protein|nr:hypothetical protein [Clostridiales bacterium]
MELTLFATAERYLKDVLQKDSESKKSQPLKKWSDEREALRMEKGGLNTEYRLMKEQVKEVEAINRNVEKTLRADEPKHEKTLARGLEL